MSEKRDAASVEEAAEALFQFLWNVKETTAPPDELIGPNCVACESAADYDEEERLTIALGRALGHDIK